MDDRGWVRSPLTDVRAGDGTLAAVTIAGADGQQERRAARALFPCIGGRPRTGWTAAAGVQTDRGGYILTGPDLLDAGERPADWPLPARPARARDQRPRAVRRR